MKKEIATWEDEGGAPASPTTQSRNGPLYGTSSQIEWAEAIRTRIDSEFDRMYFSFRAVARQQTGPQRADTETILAIIEEKRAEVLAIDQAGVYLRDWREPGGRVRRMILGDPRYLEIQAARSKRKRSPA